MKKHKTMKRRTLLFATLMAASLTLSACATVKGAGSDIQSASDSVNDGMHDR